MTNLIASAPTKERLEELINKFYCSSNYFINKEMQAENVVSGKKLGKVSATAKRWKFHL